MKSSQLSTPHLIVMVGIAGSGKTFFAEKFADTFQAPLVSDAPLIQSLTDAEVSTDHGERLLHGLVALQLDQLFKTDRTIIVDVSSDARTERTALSSHARKNGYHTLFIWVQTDLPTAKDRSVKPAKQSSNKKLTSEQFNQHVKHFTAPNASENTVVISGKHTYTTQARGVLKKLSAPRTEITKRQTAPERSMPVPIARRNITIR